MTSPEAKPYEAFKEIADGLRELFPERCQSCHVVDLAVIRAAGMVIHEGESDGQAYAENRAQDIEANCRYGLEDKGGCFGGRHCNYGLLSSAK